MLLTGANGFIGRHVAKSLSEKGYQVHGVTSSNNAHSPFVHQWHETDLLDVTSITPLVLEVKPDFLVHLAWYVSPGAYSGTENIRWVQSTIQLMASYFEVMKHNGRMVAAGSGFEYDRNYGYCVEGITPLNPDTFYGQCKNAARLLLDAFAAENDFSCAWARIFNVYGPGESPKRLVPSVITSLLSGRRASCSKGEQYRDYMHVFDVSAAIVELMEATAVTGAVNIATGIPTQVKDIIMHIGSNLNMSSLIGLGDISSAESELPFSVADVRRLSLETNFSPGYNLSEGLDQTIDWWTTNLSRPDYDN